MEISDLVEPQLDINNRIPKNLKNGDEISEPGKGRYFHCHLTPEAASNNKMAHQQNMI